MTKHGTIHSLYHRGRRFGLGGDELKGPDDKDLSGEKLKQAEKGLKASGAINKKYKFYPDCYRD